MPTMKHTPGPWRVSPDNPRKVISDSIDGFDPLSGENLVGGASAINSPERQAANARLIAAAPDLLAVLQDSVEILAVAIESREELIGEVDEVMRDLRDRVRAAIAKAEGK